MKVTHNRRYNLFQLPATKFGTVLGLIPYYNFKTHKVIFKKEFKYYSLLLACSATFLTTITICMFHTYIHTIFFIVILHCLSQVSGLSVYLITTFGAAFWNMNCWQKFITHMCLLENKMVALGLNSSWSAAKTNFRFFAGNMWHIGMIAVQGYFFEQIAPHLSTLLFFYTDFMLTTTAVDILLSIKYRFKDINKLLNEFKFSENHTERIKKLYLMTNEIVEDFNRIFGWPILGLIFHLLCQILTCLTIFTLEIPNSTVIHSILWVYGTIITIGPVVLLFSCDLAVEESRQLLPSCYRLQQYLSPYSKEGKDLKMLECILRTKSPLFTAAGFFQLNRTTLLHLLSTITTYFIVIIQFKNKI